MNCETPGVLLFMLCTPLFGILFCLLMPTLQANVDAGLDDIEKCAKRAPLLRYLHFLLRQSPIGRQWSWWRCFH